MDKKIYFIENLRAVAILTIVLLHSSASFLNANGWGTYDWWTANFIDAFTRWSVPVFVMISGAIFLNRQEDYLPFIQKRLVRILLPFTTWSIIYWVVKSYQSNTFSIPDLLTQLFTNGTSYHFWFIYMLIGLYLITPILQKWIQNADKKEIDIILIICGITTLVIPLLDLIFKVNIFKPFYLYGYIGYYILGYRLTTDKKEFNLPIIAIIFGTAWLFCLLLNYYLNIDSKTLNETAFSFTSLQVALMSVCVFYLFKKYLNFSNTVLRNIANASFGIYLIHIAVLAGVKLLYLNLHLQIPIFILILFYFIIVSVISFGITLLLQRLPFGKYIVG